MPACISSGVRRLVARGPLLVLAFACGFPAVPVARSQPRPAPQTASPHAPNDRGESLPVRGGVSLSRAQVTRLLTQRPVRVKPERDEREPCADAKFDQPRCRPNNDPVLPPPMRDNREKPEGGSPQTPAPTKSWIATFSGKAGFPADAQIAVSQTHVIVTNRQQMRYFDKNGNSLGNVISSNSFFAPLNLMDAAGNPIDRHNDLRVIFDEYRKRFWVTAYSSTSTPNVTLSKRRFFLPMAVSKTQNPQDGWYLYWWDGASQQGNAQSTIWAPGDGPDYPVLGVDPVAVTITHKVSDSNGSFKYWRVTLTPAAPLANGVAQGGWQYWSLTNPDGSKPGLIAPAVHHGSPTGGRAYWAGRQGTDTLVVWAIKDPFGPGRTLERVAVKMPQAWSSPVEGQQKGSQRRIKFTNLGTSPLKAVYRNGFLYTVTNDSRDWGGIGKARTSIRYVRVPVSGWPTVPSPPDGDGVSRTFGGGSTLENISGLKHYGWPGIEVNKLGDALIVYTRTGEEIYPEARASAYMSSASDLWPSRQLKAGEQSYALGYASYQASDALLPWGDTAGTCVDPSDDTGIWVAQQYASSAAGDNNGNYDIWVGKFFAP